ncbi:MAG: hypothetical protein K9M51_02985 [Candidatus Gracilibacteria bacterium]|nr:hypothetical protein [Candidatus Gracilibacteria bacterium]
MKETPSQEKEPQKELPEATKLAAQKFKENFFQQIDIGKFKEENKITFAYKKWFGI